MEPETTNDSSSISQNSSETLISDIHYIPAADIVSEGDEEPQPEKFVRLMSLDFNQLTRSFSSTDVDETYEVLCHEYGGVVCAAENLVSSITEEAERLINKNIKETPSKTISAVRVVKRYSEDYPIIEYNRPEFTGWPIIGHFTIELGADKIDEYLASFNTHEEWLYIIYYLGVKNDYPSKYYEYQATWSLPSTEYPIAQATASVFFTIEVSEALPLECLVDVLSLNSLNYLKLNKLYNTLHFQVTFVFENHQLRHKPGLTDFSEEFLNYILDSKIAVFRKIRF